LWTEQQLLCCGQNNSCCVVDRTTVVVLWTEQQLRCGQNNSCCVVDRTTVVVLWTEQQLLCCGQNNSSFRYRCTENRNTILLSIIFFLLLFYRLCNEEAVCLLRGTIKEVKDVPLDATNVLGHAGSIFF